MTTDGGNTVPRITSAEHIGPDDTGDNIEAKRVANYVWNGLTWERQSSTAASTGLTDAELRASPVPVSGTVTANAAAPVASTANSTTTPLAANATFTGSWEDVSDYDFIEATLYTDVNSAVNAVLLQFSTDGGTTTERTIAATILGGYGAYSYALPVTAYTHVRVIYTNGDTPQTVFHLRVVKQTGASPIIIAPIGATINSTQSAHLTRSVIAAQKVDGSLANLVTTNDGYLQVDIAQSDIDLPIKALTAPNINQMSVTTTATQLSGTSGRKTISIKALTANTANIYLGTTSAVSTGSGYELAPGDAVDVEVDTTTANWLIAASGTQRACYMEIS